MSNPPFITRRVFSISQLIVLTAVFITLFANFSFFSNALEVYPLTLKNGIFLTSLAVVSILSQIFLYSIFSHRLILKPALIIFLLVSSLTGYFMDQYGIVIDEDMINNILKTDAAEVRDLINPKLVLYVVFLGLLPSLVVFRLKLNFEGDIKEIFNRLKLVFVSERTICVFPARAQSPEILFQSGFCSLFHCELYCPFSKKSDTSFPQHRQRCKNTKIRYQS